MQISKNTYNRSAYFILPLLGIDFEHFNVGDDEEAFVNTYLYCDIDEHQKFYVVLKSDVVEKHGLSVRMIFKSKYFHAHRVEGDYYILSFIRNLKMIKAIDLIEKGKYSKISYTSQKLIVQYMKLKFTNSEGKVYKNPYYTGMFPNPETRRALEITLDEKLPKDAEILSPVNKDKETLSLK